MIKSVLFPLFLAGLSVIYSIIYAQSPGSGYALNFDGVNDYVTANAVDLNTYTNNFTIEFWANPSATRTPHPETTSGISGTSGYGQH